MCLALESEKALLHILAGGVHAFEYPWVVEASFHCLGCLQAEVPLMPWRALEVEGYLHYSISPDLKIITSASVLFLWM